MSKPKKRPYNRAKLYPERISVSLPKDIHDLIQQEAEDKGISLSQALREQVIDWWAQEKIQERDEVLA